MGRGHGEEHSILKTVRTAAKVSLHILKLAKCIVLISTIDCIRHK